ncbi:hypothetical protein [Treponema endosymbiont of Eucomonympha sp.]|uniref:hypothetical protein n=1 Tax=Treponema endosymbiont of Eucomonympha sp. TaxID=1580831 RepID=UPI000A9C57F5|nr:hypothetical protein [Treponema endosymbiont of Eucomonympha sp.]
MFPKRIIAAGVAALSLAACSGISSEPPASVTLEAAYARVSARAKAAHLRFSFEDFAQMYLDEGYDSVQEYERCWLDALPLANDRAANRTVDPIAEQYTMQDYPWGQEKIPGGGLMEKKGCAITLAANIAVSEGVSITPETIRSDNGNFNASGLKWDTALSCTRLGIGGKVYGQLSASTFNNLNDTRLHSYYIGIQVNYTGDASDTHWVGASDIVPRAGKEYYRISKTSKCDNILGTTSSNNRGGMGWEIDPYDKSVLVPVECVSAYRVFTIT